MDIVCISTGIPVPTVAWTFNGRSTLLRTSEIVTGFEARPHVLDSGRPPIIHLGRTMSTLHITDAEYPRHDGVYECTGTNDETARSSTDFTLTVYGMYV